VELEGSKRNAIEMAAELRWTAKRSRCWKIIGIKISND
jgi:hypothetical protein